MGQQLVVTEGVYSMDGNSAPLAEIQHIARRHHAWLLVDDAHGIGVTGDEGGHLLATGVKPELLVVTFGKGFGVSGAAVLCLESVAIICCNSPVIWFTAPVCRPPRRRR